VPFLLPESKGRKKIWSRPWRRSIYRTEYKRCIKNNQITSKVDSSKGTSHKQKENWSTQWCRKHKQRFIL